MSTTDLFIQQLLSSFSQELEKIAGRRGLWDNIHAKRARIAAGSGERMRKPGSEGAPTAKALRVSKSTPTKTAGVKIAEDAPGYFSTFIAGADPFGIKIGDLGQRAERANTQGAQSTGLLAAGTAGGALGGAVVVPAGIGGLIGGAKAGISTSGGLGKRLAAAATGGIQGAISPFEGLYHAGVSRSALRKSLKEGYTATPEEWKSLQYVLSKAPVSAVTSKMPADQLKALQTLYREGPPKPDIRVNKDTAKKVVDAVRDRKNIVEELQADAGRRYQALDKTRREVADLIDAGKISPTIGGQLEEPISEAYKSGLTQLALGGGVGGVAAGVQYQKGRETERDFKNRTFKLKTAGVKEHFESKFHDYFTPEQAKEMQYALILQRKMYEEKLAKTKPGTVAHWFRKRQVDGMQRDIDSFAPFIKKASIEYRGTTFPGYNKPVPSNRKGKKKMVLVKRGDKVKLVHFGQKGYQDFTQHKDPERRKNYLARSGGIRGKGGKLTANDPFSANYWARKELW